MFDNLFSEKSVAQALEVLKNEIPLAIWETLYVTVLATFFAIVLGLPLGVLLVAGEDGKIPRVARGVLHVLNVIINLLRSVPFLILMVLVMPLSRVILGTSIGTAASIVPLTIAAFPFVARLVEGSLREMDRGIIEAAQAMGCSTLQIIWKVLLPECLPSLLTGFTTAFVTILGYGAMSGAIGGGGLGNMALNRGWTRKQTFVLYTAVVFLVILVQIFQSIGAHLTARTDRRLARTGRKGSARKAREKIDREKRIPPGAM